MATPKRTLKPLLRKGLRITLLVMLFMAMAGIGTYLSLTLLLKGENTVVVPDLVGEDVLYSLEILSDLGLNTRVRGTVYHDQVPRNHVIDQDPDPGSTIKQGRDVRIRVSRGPETIVMPNLIGLTVQQSLILLAENGLCPGTRGTMTDASHPAGQVLAHHPPSGATIDRNTCADLLVSSGPPAHAIKMADLSGLPLSSAVRRLTAHQLTVGTIRAVSANASPVDTIVDQLPMAGHRVAAGSSVNVTVNRPETGAQIGSDPEGVSLFGYVLESGFLNKRVRVDISRTQLSLTLFDDYLNPGQEVWLFIPKSGNPTVLVYVDGELAATHLLN